MRTMKRLAMPMATQEKISFLVNKMIQTLTVAVMIAVMMKKVASAASFAVVAKRRKLMMLQQRLLQVVIVETLHQHRPPKLRLTTPTKLHCFRRRREAKMAPDSVTSHQRRTSRYSSVSRCTHGSQATTTMTV